MRNLGLFIAVLIFNLMAYMAVRSIYVLFEEAKPIPEIDYSRILEFVNTNILQNANTEGVEKKSTPTVKTLYFERYSIGKIEGLPVLVIDGRTYLIGSSSPWGRLITIDPALSVGLLPGGGAILLRPMVQLQFPLLAKDSQE